MATLLSALNVNRMQQFHASLENCCKELFGLTEQQFNDRWQKNPCPKKVKHGGTGTGRPYWQPTAHALFQNWKQTRDATWLYTHPEYKWDSIGCSVYESCPAVGAGIKLLKDQGISPRRIFDWGAGPGFTTLMLASEFPNAEVHYHEYNPPSAPGDLERIFDWFVKNQASHANVRHVAQPSGEYDLIVGMEIVEHFEHPEKPKVGAPMANLDALLQRHASPDAALLQHSCWSAERNDWVTLGHFEYYDFDGLLVSNRKASSQFKKAMKHRGWHEVASGWNSRPSLFLKV